MPRDAVRLFIDATTLRWFPPSRSAWGFRGEQVLVKITGRDAKRVLFGAIDPRTGHRPVLRRLRRRQEDFRAFLRHPRQHYPGRPLWLLLDEAPCHDAVRSQPLAARLGVVLLWLPRQCPELNAMDQLFEDRKRRIAANRQYQTIDEEADYAEHRILGLTTRQALRKASVLSGGFWLKDFLKNFWPPT
jgi:hypothetical protein